MYRRTKTSLLAVLALAALPAMSACMLMPSGNDDPDPAPTDETQVENGGEASFNGADDFFSQVGESIDNCEQTSTEPIPEEATQAEPALVGSIYAFCTFSDGEQIIGVLLPDANDSMADTSLSTSAEVDAFKQTSGVTSLAIGGNWLVTSPTDALVDEFVEHFGGTVY